VTLLLPFLFIKHSKCVVIEWRREAVIRQAAAWCLLVPFFSILVFTVLIINSNKLKSSNQVLILNPKLFSQMSVTLLSVQQDPKLKDNKITKLHYLSNTALLKIIFLQKLKEISFENLLQRADRAGLQRFKYGPC
jgi:hypothetical protein